MVSKPTSSGLEKGGTRDMVMSFQSKRHFRRTRYGIRRRS